MKTCSKCSKLLNFSNFHKSKHAPDGLDYRCKECCKLYKKQHRIENIEKYKHKRKLSYEKIKDDQSFKNKKAAYDRSYYLANKDMIDERNKKWKDKTKKERRRVSRLWLKAKRKSDIRYKLNSVIGNSMRESLKSGKNNKSWKMFVDYDINDLILHIESLFTTNMSWDNHGVNGWHIDHVIPVSSFDLSKKSEIKKCWAISNLEPRWATSKIAIQNGESKDYIGNIEKSNKIL